MKKPTFYQLKRSHLTTRFLWNQCFRGVSIRCAAHADKRRVCVAYLCVNKLRDTQRDELLRACTLLVQQRFSFLFNFKHEWNSEIKSLKYCSWSLQIWIFIPCIYKKHNKVQTYQKNSILRKKQWLEYTAALNDVFYIVRDTKNKKFSDQRVLWRCLPRWCLGQTVMSN